jgi:spore coat polysaccharide biosynthesis predicted glycosyltransferase SpsG
MNRDPVLFRVDGTPRVGWEHLARCQTLAAALQRRRRPTYFLSQLEPGSLGLPLKRSGNDWLEADAPAGTAEDLQEIIQEVRRIRPAAVIVDAPDVKEDYLIELRAAGTMVVSIDSQATLRFTSRLIINPLLGPGKEAYELVNGTQLLVGPRYALVRSDIRRVRPLRSVEPAQPFRALVMLGDDDPNNQSGELANLLLNTPKVQRVDVVVRSHHQGLDELRALAEARPERLEIAIEPAEVVARIGRAHFAVTAGNAASLDLACVGVPQLLIVQNEVYWPTAQRLEEEGAAMCLGWHATVSPQTVRQTVQDLLDDAQERQAMARCGRQLIDGRGQDRLVTALEILLHPSRQVSFSEAA